MINLSNYIKHDFIKKLFLKSCTVITTIELAKIIAESIFLKKNIKSNLIFEYSYLKDYFFTIIKKYNNDIYIINCESSNNRLEEDIKDIYKKNFSLYIFDHVNNCNNINIINNLINKPHLLIC